MLMLASLTFTSLTQTMERLQQLRRAVSEGTGKDGLINRRPPALAIPTSPNNGPLSARIDDSARTRKVWEVLQILTLANKIPEFNYDSKRQRYVTSPITSPLSPEEIQRVFPVDIDSHLNTLALPLDFADGRKYLYLPGVAKEDDGLCEFGCFEYRLLTAPNPAAYNLPETFCYHRKFNPIEPEEFSYDDLLLESFDADNPLTGPSSLSKPLVFNHLKEVQRVLIEEQSKLKTADQSTFPICILKNLRTLLIAQAKIINKSPDVTRKLKGYQNQINSSKKSLAGSKESLHDLESAKEIYDQIGIIDKHRQLQVTALLEAWEQQSA
jgi:hypothetical protein